MQAREEERAEELTWRGEVIHLIVEDDASGVGHHKGTKVGVDC